MDPRADAMEDRIKKLEKDMADIKKAMAPEKKK